MEAGVGSAATPVIGDDATCSGNGLKARIPGGLRLQTTTFSMSTTSSSASTPVPMSSPPRSSPNGIMQTASSPSMATTTRISFSFGSGSPQGFSIQQAISSARKSSFGSPHTSPRGTAAAALSPRQQQQPSCSPPLGFFSASRHEVPATPGSPLAQSRGIQFSINAQQHSRDHVVTMDVTPFSLHAEPTTPMTPNRALLEQNFGELHIAQHIDQQKMQPEQQQPQQPQVSSCVLAMPSVRRMFLSAIPAPLMMQIASPSMEPGSNSAATHATRIRSNGMDESEDTIMKDQCTDPAGSGGSAQCTPSAPAVQAEQQQAQLQAPRSLFELLSCRKPSHSPQSGSPTEHQANSSSVAVAADGGGGSATQRGTVSQPQQQAQQWQVPQPRLQPPHQQQSQPQTQQFQPFSTIELFKKEDLLPHTCFTTSMQARFFQSLPMESQQQLMKQQEEFMALYEHIRLASAAAVADSKSGIDAASASASSRTATRPVDSKFANEKKNVTRILDSCLTKRSHLMSKSRSGHGLSRKQQLLSAARAHLAFGGQFSSASSPVSPPLSPIS